MVERGMLISLAERRHRMAALGEGPLRTDATAKGRSLGLGLFVASVLALGILVATLSADRRMDPIIHLPAQVRAPWQRQVLAELRTFCGEPAAASGKAHEHCTEQARFLLLFPECDAGCRREAWAIATPVHR